eukprot:CAMPEP_0183483968 /NCGR_PEP_ID=MMETSP0370-20130417/178685_1 /TAXON_ID=268820 /ORGANISM="Peridinium aciculiferum, Strain PAER-2" /LENGTH=214 /DNA_ID=CAMNT_0025677251 /DNA_START=27 /DNA_END=672 /DNA_ORIENTATION=-
MWLSPSSCRHEAQGASNLQLHLFDAPDDVNVILRRRLGNGHDGNRAEDLEVREARQKRRRSFLARAAHSQQHHANDSSDRAHDAEDDRDDDAHVAGFDGDRGHRRCASDRAHEAEDDRDDDAHVAGFDGDKGHRRCGGDAGALGCCDLTDHLRHHSSDGLNRDCVVPVPTRASKLGISTLLTDAAFMLVSAFRTLDEEPVADVDDPSSCGTVTT